MFFRVWCASHTHHAPCRAGSWRLLTQSDWLKVQLSLLLTRPDAEFWCRHLYISWINALPPCQLWLNIGILRKVIVFSAMGLSMSIHRTLCLLVSDRIKRFSVMASPIAFPSSYPCQWVSQWVSEWLIVSDFPFLSAIVGLLLTYHW